MRHFIYNSISRYIYYQCKKYVIQNYGGEIIEKFKIGIIAICLIFLVGGCYAIYHGNDLASNAATDISSSPNTDNIPSNDVNNQPNSLQNSNINTAKDISQNNKINNYASTLEITYRQIPGADLFVNKEIDYTDMYLQCVACGGFIALGEITKALPEDALCPDLCGGHSINDNADYAVTYEFAKAFYDKYGRHPEEIQDTDVAASSDDANIPATNWDDLNLPEDAKIVVYDMNSNSDVVYDTIEPVPNSVDKLVLTPIDMPTDFGAVSDTSEPVSIEQ